MTDDAREAARRECDFFDRTLECEEHYPSRPGLCSKATRRLWAECYRLKAENKKLRKEVRLLRG